jgi:hypothetical protein
VRILILMICATSVSAAVSGCGVSAPAEVTAQANTTRSTERSKYLLSNEPDGAIGVIAARAAAHDGDPIVVVGRIGGIANPWIDGRAAFMLLDASIKLVPEGTESKAGAMCTGDCCASERARNMTLVKLVDENGRLLTVDARQLLGVNANDLVVIRGKTNKDDSGNLIVLANGVFIRR